MTQQSLRHLCNIFNTFDEKRIFMKTLTRKTGLRGTITVPGDKSISHRAIMFGALADGVTTIHGFLKGADCLSTIGCFRKMGIVIEEKNERKAFEIGPNAHFYLDENVVWDLHFIIFFDICSMFLVNSISCPVEDGTAAPGNPVHPILYNRPDNRCPGNSPHSCSSMSPISDLV